MDNWRKLKTYGFKGGKNISSKQDKGHYNQFNELIAQQEKGGNPIIPFESIINTTKASFAAIDSLNQQQWVYVD